MKKNLIAMMLSIVMAAGSISGYSAYAAESATAEAGEVIQEDAVSGSETSEENEETGIDAVTEGVLEEEPAQEEAAEEERAPETEEVIGESDTAATAEEAADESETAAAAEEAADESETAAAAEETADESETAAADEEVTDGQEDASGTEGISETTDDEAEEISAVEDTNGKEIIEENEEAVIEEEVVTAVETEVYDATAPIATSESYRSGVYYTRLLNALDTYGGASQVNRFVAIALSQEGYTADSTYGNNSGYGDGKGSYCEYTNPNTIGSYGADWCAAFISWSARMAGLPEAVVPTTAGAGTFRRVGTQHRLWSNDFTTYQDYRPRKGDILLNMPDNSSGKYNSWSLTAHVAIIAEDSTTRASDGGWLFTTIERNGQRVGKVSGYSTKRTFSNANANNVHMYQMIVTPNWQDSNHDPNGYLDVAAGGLGTIRVRGWAYDPDEPSKSIAVHVYVGGRAGQGPECHVIMADDSRDDVNAAFGISGVHGFDDTFTTSLSGPQPIYLYAIDTAGGNNPQFGEATVTVTKDSTAPVIKNIRITDLTKDGYTVTCDVSDNVAVSRVAFPTWTSANGQDDLLWKDGTVSNGTASFRVKKSDHGNESGDYITHIYAYDAAGNQSSANTGAYVDGTPPVISNIRATDITTGGFTVACNVSDNIGVTRVSFRIEKSDGSGYSKDGTVSNGTASLRVDTSGIPYQDRAYSATISAYDAAGNVSYQKSALDLSMHLTSIQLPKTMTVKYGNTLPCQVTYVPEDTTDDKTVKWSSGNTSIFTVSNKGVVTPTGIGTAVLTAKVGNLSATSSVTVRKGTPKYSEPGKVNATCGQTLSAIELPAGFEWDTPDQNVGSAGTKSFTVTFTPDDAAHYDSVGNITVTVNVEHAWNEDYTVDKKATTTEEGSKSIHCSVCDAVKEGSEVTIPKLAIKLGKTTRGDMFNLANNVKVTWKEVSGAKYYKVYREGVTDPSESLDEPVIVTERLIGWDQQPGLTNGHAYRYRIVASLTGRGDPSGDSQLSYSKLMYRLKTVVIRSVKNTAPGKVTVKYDRTTSGDSYVLQYCERQDMVGAKTKVVLGANNTSYTIGGLKKGKTYYISIRVRKKVDGIDYYTTFGVAKKITLTQ